MTTEPRRPAAGPPRRRPRPLRGARARILVTVVTLLAASTVLSTVILRQVLLARVDERVDAALVQEVDEFRALAADGVDPFTGRALRRDPRATFDLYLSRNVPNRDESWFTFLDGRPYRSTARRVSGAELARAVRGLGATRAPRRGTVELRSGPTAYLAVPVTVDGRSRGVFVVTADLGAERSEVAQAVRVAAGVSLAVLGLASLAAFLLIGRILAPLRELTETARSIGEADLTRRIAVRGDDEIAVLAATFNEMLDRLDAAFGAQRAFVSDAGHELRTPITIVRGHLELLGDDPAERAETMELVEDELERMSRIVEELLLLARSDDAGFLRSGPIDLDLFAEELLAKARPLGDRAWTLDEVATGTIVGDRQRLTQAMVNLLANAAQHSERGTTIALGGDRRAGEVRLWVRDEGSGVPEEDRERIFERFARGRNGRRSDGAGLGLAIVRAIATAHGGRVELESREGAGSTFTVVLPDDPWNDDEEER